MKELVKKLLEKEINRRDFIKRLSALGFSFAAAESIWGSFSPYVEAAPLASAAGKIVEGTGGKILVEQLKASGNKYIFSCHSSGTYPIWDVLIEDPDIMLHLMRQYLLQQDQ